MKSSFRRVVVVAALSSACGAAPPPTETKVPQSSTPAVAPAPAANGAPLAMAPVPPEKSAPVPATLPHWLSTQRAFLAAMTLVGGDAAHAYVLAGQFELDEEAILRLDRRSGCVDEVIGPWPKLAWIVRAGRSMNGPAAPVSVETRIALAQSAELRAELAAIHGVYSKFQNVGEDKLAFSVDGKRIMIQSGDDDVLVSSDGGARFARLPGASIDMPVVSADGRFGAVRSCTGKKCGGPQSGADYHPLLVDMDSPMVLKPLGGPSLHDLSFSKDGQDLLLVRSDAYGRAAPTKACLVSHSPPTAPTGKTLACASTRFTGDWRMLSTSPGARYGVIATVGPQRGNARTVLEPVRLSVRSLADGSEKDVFPVPGDWEAYQWINVLVSDRGVVAYAEHTRESKAHGVDMVLGGATNAPVEPIIVRSAGASAPVGVGRPLGFVSDHELVVVDPAGAEHRDACRLFRVIDVDKVSAP